MGNSFVPVNFNNDHISDQSSDKILPLSTCENAQHFNKRKLTRDTTKTEVHVLVFRDHCHQRPCLQRITFGYNWDCHQTDQRYHLSREIIFCCCRMGEGGGLSREIVWLYMYIFAQISFISFISAVHFDTCRDLPFSLLVDILMIFCLENKNTMQKLSCNIFSFWVITYQIIYMPMSGVAVRSRDSWRIWILRIGCVIQVVIYPLWLPQLSSAPDFLCDWLSVGSKMVNARCLDLLQKGRIRIASGLIPCMSWLYRLGCGVIEVRWLPAKII